MKVLVTGLVVYDSGKTWFTVTMARKLINKGFKVSIYKPVAGHSLWYQYVTILESSKRGMLLGEDILRYGEVLGIKNEEVLRLMNPIDILFAPLDIVKYIDNKNIESMFLDFENHYLQMVLSRVSLCSNNVTRYYIFRENISRTTRPMREIIESLAERFNAVEIDIANFNSFLQSREIDEELNVCLNTLARNSDIVLIESFNNSVVPYIGLIKEGIDGLFVVYPGVVLIYRNSLKDIIKFVKQHLYIHGTRALTTEILLHKFRYDRCYMLRPRISLYEDDEVFNAISKDLIS